MTHVIKARIEVISGEPTIRFDVVKHYLDPDGGCSTAPSVIATYKSESGAQYACLMLNKHTGKVK